MAELSAGAALSQAASTGQALRPERIDDVGRALLLLARELWVTRDRQHILEAVLAERGIEVAAAIRDYRPSPELTAALAAERQAYTDALVEALCPPQGV